MLFSVGITDLQTMRYVFVAVHVIINAGIASAKNPTVDLRYQGGPTPTAVSMPRMALGTGGYDNATAQDAVSKVIMCFGLFSNLLKIMYTICTPFILLNLKSPSTRVHICTMILICL